MKLIITIMQRGKKVKTIESQLAPTTTLETVRKIWEAEVLLNSIPSDLRFHFKVEEN